jgi:hypothetical protein
MNRLADSVMPESEAARQFDILVDSALYGRDGMSESSLGEIQRRLSLWNENDSKIKPIIEQSYLLGEAGSLSELLADLCKTGLQSLDYMKSRQKAPESWQKESLALLDRADKPQAGILIAITPSIRKLVDVAASGMFMHADRIIFEPTSGSKR